MNNMCFTNLNTNELQNINGGLDRTVLTTGIAVTISATAAPPVANVVIAAVGIGLVVVSFFLD